MSLRGFCLIELNEDLISGFQVSSELSSQPLVARFTLCSLNSLGHGSRDCQLISINLGGVMGGWGSGKRWSSKSTTSTCGRRGGSPVRKSVAGILPPVRAREGSLLSVAPASLWSWIAGVRTRTALISAKYARAYHASRTIRTPKMLPRPFSPLGF
jgi:hypothetical protein